MVTGGGTGIGFAIAAEMADAGADVVIVGRREEKLREMESRLSEAADIARRCGVTKDEFLQTAETLFTE